MFRKYFICISLFACYFSGFSQTDDKNLIQFSGVVVNRDSLHPIPFSNVMIKGTYRGTISDYYGFFSFVARLTDTVEFSSIGYKRNFYIIPDSLKENRYSLIQILIPDTIQLKEAVIFPWPSKEQFKQAFLNASVPDDDLARARKNLSERNMKEIAESLPVDGSLTFKYQMQQQYSRLYSAGQLPKNNLLNPIAWAQFISAWKNGDFKRKKDKYDE
ncbi:MAG: carboxypeptidase-like regulatory domain-containing protein [Bacteroidota bacterium]